MEGGELFDRIQKKGHFTERGTLEPGGRRGGGEGGGGGGRGGGGGGGIIFDLDTTVMCYVIPNGSLWKSSNFQFLGVMGGFKVSPLVL